MNLEKFDVLYDIYDYEVVPLEFIGHYLNHNYVLFVNKSTDKPISVYIKRVPELFTDELEAFKALEEILLSKLQVNNEKIKEIINERGN